MPSLVTHVPAADSASAVLRFESAFSFETLIIQERCMSAIPAAVPSAVTAIPAAPSAAAEAHFAAEFAFETDCWDVHEALARGPDFVLIDVRSSEAFARSHVPGAINIPHAKIIAARMACYRHARHRCNAGPHSRRRTVSPVRSPPCVRR